MSANREITERISSSSQNHQLTTTFSSFSSPSPIGNESNSTFNDLFVDTPLEVGKSLSKNEREEHNLSDEKSLIYGEVEYKSFYKILRKINAKPGLTFYDLGSGTGKAVFAARLTHDFARCIGIEILSGLHNQAFHITQRYNEGFRHLLDSSQRQHAAVYKGSLLEYNWADGDVVFANSTCFDDSLMNAMSKMAQQLKPGAIVVTFTRGLTNIEGVFELLEKKREKMSWGPATVFIHRRLNPDGSPVGPANLNLLPSDSIEMEEAADVSDDSEEDEEDEEEEDESEDEEEDSEDEEEDEDSLDSNDANLTEEKVRKLIQRYEREFGMDFGDYLDDPSDPPAGAPSSPPRSDASLTVDPPSPRAEDSPMRYGPMGGNMGFSSPQDSTLQKRKASRQAFSGFRDA
jgi:SAM-dependent methyltransferase